MNISIEPRDFSVFSLLLIFVNRLTLVSFSVIVVICLCLVDGLVGLFELFLQQ